MEGQGTSSSTKFHLVDASRYHTGMSKLVKWTIGMMALTTFVGVRVHTTDVNDTPNLQKPDIPDKSVSSAVKTSGKPVDPKTTPATTKATEGATLATTDGLQAKRLQNIIDRITQHTPSGKIESFYFDVIQKLGKKDLHKLPDDVIQTVTQLKDGWVPRHKLISIAKSLAKLLVAESYGDIPNTFWGKRKRREHQMRLMFYIVAALSKPTALRM
ncbi:DNA mismatch repair protein, putative [Babesia ovis]|uniref:DNA mismatch repair protein, putative n=1 Tax=Babesia ovis TaxID=5869 RepID=A0A9W5WW95_BABOV|nr:DNA mismatch repair protein, putative [Babesia ovis]